MLLIGWDSGPEKLCFFPLRPVGSGCNISGRFRRPTPVNRLAGSMKRYAGDPHYLPKSRGGNFAQLA